MSTQAPWLALAVDWQDSDMLEGATAEERLAWVCLLCHAKTNGRAGVVKFRMGAFTQRWQITKTAAQSMLERAAIAGAIQNGSDGAISVVNWKSYQDPKHRGGQAQPIKPQALTTTRGGFSKSAQNDATPYPLPLTPNPVPLSPPTPLGGRDENRNQTDDLFSTESPPPKSRRPKSNKSKQAKADARVLYEAYPRHVAPAAALKAITKALRTIPLAELLPKVQAYADSPDVQAKLGTPDEEFIPHPATWFNAGRWMDEKGESRGSRFLEEQ